MKKLDFILWVGLPILALVIIAQVRGARRARRLTGLISQGKQRISVAPKKRGKSPQQMAHYEVM